MNSEKHSKAIDLSHHFSEVAKTRKPSPLKELSKYFGRKDLISLGGGLPHPAYFPLSGLSVDALVPDSFALAPAEHSSSLSWLWKLLGANTSPKEKTASVYIPKYSTDTNDINLAAALQYGAAVGQPQLQNFLRQFVSQVYQPAFEDFTTLIHTGNTDGWCRAFGSFCNPGEGVLMEEWNYPSAMAAMLPSNIRPVTVAMDGQGMRSDALEKVLSEWDEEVRQMPRPHVLYIVPVGQNPCGTTMKSARKEQIYDVCVKYDVIIVEDDPYFFMQLGDYEMKSVRSPFTSHSSGRDQAARFVSSLEPSFLRYDYQGRVVRLDTFSKTIAPGSRLGFFTCNPIFAERFERQGETSTQSPCGFGQSIVTKILTNWKYDGYIRWLQGLRTEYAQRRDFFIDCLAEEFDLQAAPAPAGIWEGCLTYQAFSNRRISNTTEKSSPLFSFVPPNAGMFVWLKLNLERHPSFTSEAEGTLEFKLWTLLAEDGVIFAPGWFFPTDDVATSDVGAGHFRISYSNAEYANLKKAVTVFGRVIREFFNEQN
ncbi:pyridoxal phosphate-dependent transferase [Hygrophoropsis aurantiaca]|uniref:Pyridoxal phosphate-dependent transferase n=1 Tax=Hygrophoropsis aurantiaca TaxID=72124 RepID=A0ACB8ASG3_9AGAM|nr:pyridoxal phosphate-dependent transferase [Hygrophoropsis aurantiaca]